MLSVSPNGAAVGYGSVVKAAQAIAPYVDGFSMNNIPAQRPADDRLPAGVQPGVLVLTGRRPGW
jgi:hypothetical protein